jgi:hypothetical protein
MPQLLPCQRKGGKRYPCRKPGRKGRTFFSGKDIIALSRIPEREKRQVFHHFPDIGRRGVVGRISQQHRLMPRIVIM